MFTKKQIAPPSLEQKLMIQKLEQKSKYKFYGTKMRIYLLTVQSNEL
jgi:hypothetical protein